MAKPEDMRIQVSDFDQLAELMKANLANPKPVGELGTQAVQTEVVKVELESKD